MLTEQSNNVVSWKNMLLRNNKIRIILIPQFLAHLVSYSDRLCPSSVCPFVH